MHLSKLIARGPQKPLDQDGYSINPAVATISLGQQDTLAGDEGLAQTQAGSV
jgi:hypothetical protein